jgi:hypothetical protein
MAQRRSLRPWFTSLLLLNVMDILATNPGFESNPLTLYLWGQVGIFFSAWLKVGLVLLFGVLYILAKRVTKPTEWAFTRKIFSGLLVLLVTFYSFVVSWNIFIYIIRI